MSPSVILTSCLNEALASDTLYFSWSKRINPRTHARTIARMIAPLSAWEVYRSDEYGTTLFMRESSGNDYPRIMFTLRVTPACPSIID